MAVTHPAHPPPPSNIPAPLKLSLTCNLGCLGGGTTLQTLISLFVSTQSISEWSCISVHCCSQSLFGRTLRVWNPHPGKFSAGPIQFLLVYNPREGRVTALFSVLQCHAYSLEIKPPRDGSSATLDEKSPLSIPPWPRGACRALLSFSDMPPWVETGIFGGLLIDCIWWAKGP